MLRNMYGKLKLKLYAWLTHEPAEFEILPFDYTRMRDEIKPGDVLLIAGRSRVSMVIRTLSQSSWTHAALYIGRTVDIEDEALEAKIKAHGVNIKDSTRLVIEDLMDRGTVVTALHEYKRHHIRICRPIGITPPDIQVVLKHAIRALGHPYNVRHLLDLARFLLPWSILPRRWGSSLFRTPSGKPESGICSSLIAEAFHSVQFPILPYMIPGKDGNELEIFNRNPHLFTPKDFDYSPYFEIIKYPLFSPEEPLPYYRRMPWTKRDLMHQDNGILSGHKKKNPIS
jgi:hypothetical protein